MQNYILNIKNYVILFNFPASIREIRGWGCSTNVECILQIDLFLQNKARLRNVQMNVSIITTRDYDDLGLCDRVKNKAKQSQSPAFGRKSEARSSKFETRTVLGRTQNALRQKTEDNAG